MKKIFLKHNLRLFNKKIHHLSNKINSGSGLQLQPYATLGYRPIFDNVKKINNPILNHQVLSGGLIRNMNNLSFSTKKNKSKKIIF